MRKKDAIALGIIEGHFKDEQKARQYCEHYGLKVEFKSTSSKGAFLMKISNREGWISPKSWLDNHLAELKRQFSELSDRLGNLGEPTSKPTPITTSELKPITLFFPDKGEKLTINGIVRAVLNGLRVNYSNYPAEIIDTDLIYSEFETLNDEGIDKAFVDAIDSLRK